MLPKYRFVNKHLPRDTGKSEVKKSYGELQNKENISSNHLIHSEICFLFDKGEEAVRNNQCFMSEHP